MTVGYFWIDFCPITSAYLNISLRICLDFRRQHGFVPLANTFISFNMAPLTLNYQTYKSIISARQIIQSQLIWKNQFSAGTSCVTYGFVLLRAHRVGRNLLISVNHWLVNCLNKHKAPNNICPGNVSFGVVYLFFLHKYNFEGNFK